MRRTGRVAVLCFARFALAGAAISAAAAVGTPTIAHAQQPAKPNAGETEARLRFEEGLKLAEASDHEAARLKFNQAWALLKSPAILFNLARAEQLSGHPTEALEHYRQFAKLPADPKVTEAQRQRANENVAELAKTLGQIDVEAPTGARISIDGRPIDAAYTDPVPVTPGKHVVEAIVEGKPRSITVECQAGTITKARLHDANIGGPTPPPKPDGDPTGKAATAPAATEPPKEQSPGFWTTGRVIGVGAGVVGLAAIGVGIVFAANASKAEDDANKIRETFAEPRDSACSGTRANENAAACAQLRDKLDDNRKTEDLRTAFIFGGATLIVGGAVLFFFASPTKSADPSRGNIRVVPMASAQQAGLTILGRF